jgi:histidyl-tRNA synthetase
MKGIAEIEQILTLVNEPGIKTLIQLDFTLARGLNYYTGTIIEVKSNDVKIGSICGGGRYDNLTAYLVCRNFWSGIPLAPTEFMMCSTS